MFRRRVDDHVAFTVMRVREDVGHAHDRRVRDVVRPQLLHRLVEMPNGEPFVRESEDDLEMLGARLRAREAWVTRKLWPSQHGTEALEEVLRRRGKHDPAAIERLV